MKMFSRIKRMLRGEVSAGTAALEAVRRVNAGLGRRQEVRELAELNRQPAKLLEEFARMPAVDRLAHFRSRQSPQFFPGFSNAARTASLQRELLPAQTEE